jgi:hypothetical protein
MKQMKSDILISMDGYTVKVPVTIDHTMCWYVNLAGYEAGDQNKMEVPIGSSGKTMSLAIASFVRDYKEQAEKK